MAEAGGAALHTGTRPVAGAALVLGAASLWATFGLFAKYLYAAGFQPLELASVRAFVGFAGMAVWVAARAMLPGGARAMRESLRLPLSALPFFIAYGVFGFALFELLFFAALGRTSVAIAVALLYTAPAMVVIVSALVWHERVGRVRLTALALVLAGVLLVTGAADALLRGTAPLSTIALLLGVGSGATYALYTMFSKLATERYGPVAALFWSFLFATLALALAASPVAPLVQRPEHLLALVGLGIVPTLVPYACYLLALRQLRASTAAMLASAEPAIATLLAAAVLGEEFGAVQGVGVALIVVAGVLLAGRAADRTERDRSVAAAARGSL